MRFIFRVFGVFKDGFGFYGMYGSTFLYGKIKLGCRGLFRVTWVILSRGV